MLSYVLLAATQLCEASEALHRQYLELELSSNSPSHFPEPGVCRKLADGLHNLGYALAAESANPQIDAFRKRCLKAADDLLDTLD